MAKHLHTKTIQRALGFIEGMDTTDALELRMRLEASLEVDKTDEEAHNLFQEAYYLANPLPQAEPEVPAKKRTRSKSNG